MLQSPLHSLKTKLKSSALQATIKPSQVILITGTAAQARVACQMLAVLVEHATCLEITEHDNPASVAQLIKNALKRHERVIIAADTHALERIGSLKFELMAVLNCDTIAQADDIGQKLRRRPRFIVLNHDDTYFNQFDQYPPAEQSITFGTNLDADCRLIRANLTKKGASLQLIVDRHKEVELKTPLEGKTGAYTTLLVFAAAYVLHVPVDEILDGIASFREAER